MLLKSIARAMKNVVALVLLAVVGLGSGSASKARLVRLAEGVISSVIGDIATDIWSGEPQQPHVTQVINRQPQDVSIRGGGDLQPRAGGMPTLKSPPADDGPAPPHRV